MKRRILVFMLALVACMVVCACNDSKDDVNEFIYPDYPLLEYTFDEADEWLVVICEDVYEADGEYYINDNAKSLELNKEKLVVNAIPNGRGTTAEDIVWIYKNGELLKNVPCFDYEILDDSFERDFDKVSYEKIAELVNLDI